MKQLLAACLISTIVCAEPVANFDTLSAELVIPVLTVNGDSSHAYSATLKFDSALRVFRAVDIKEFDCVSQSNTTRFSPFPTAINYDPCALIRRDLIGD